MDITPFDDLDATENQTVAKDNPDSWLWAEDPFKLYSESHIGQHASLFTVQMFCKRLPSSLLALQMVNYVAISLHMSRIVHSGLLFLQHVRLVGCPLRPRLS